MQEMKYIIPEDYKAPILFHSLYTHADIAQQHGKCISAGFVQITAKDNKVVVSCYGESVSLKLKSNPEVDNKLITKMIDPYADL